MRPVLAGNPGAEHVIAGGVCVLRRVRSKRGGERPDTFTKAEKKEFRAKVAEFGQLFHQRYQLLCGTGSFDKEAYGAVEEKKEDEDDPADLAFEVGNMELADSEVDDDAADEDEVATEDSADGEAGSGDEQADAPAPLPPSPPSVRVGDTQRRRGTRPRVGTSPCRRHRRRSGPWRRSTRPTTT